MNPNRRISTFIKTIFALIVLAGCVAGEVQDPKKKGEQLIGLTSITPTAGISMGGYPVVVSGSGFSAATTVSIGGTSCSVISSSSSQIACTLGALSSGSSSVDVVVSDARNGSARLSGAFEIVGNPFVTSISPVGAVTTGGDFVTIIGSNFTNTGGTPTVSVGGVSCSSVSYISSTALACQVGARTNGVVDVVVTNPGGLTGTGSSLFEYLDDPSVSSVSPVFGRSSGGDTIVINGTNFSNHTALPSVSVAGVNCSSLSYISNIQLSCVTGVMSSGAQSVVVTNASAQSGTLAASYTSQDAPTITSISPNYGTTAGGTLITVTGTNFSTLGANPTVSIGGSNCVIGSVSPTSLQCTTTASTTGSKSVVITNADTQGVTLVSGFTYQAAPSVSAVSPVGGVVAGGNSVTISGTGFSALGGNPTVTIGGIACTSINVTSATSLTCLAPAHASAIVDIVVTNADTQTATGSSLYEFMDAPTFSSLTPSSGTTVGGTTLTINGTNFSNHTGAPVILIGGVTCYGVTYVSSTQLTCITGAHSAGLVDISITNRSGLSGTSSNVFTYQVAPSVTSISPNSGPIAGGTSVTILGANFSSAGAGPSISIGGSTCSGITFNSATSLSCTTGSATAGIKNIAVTNADTQVGYLSNGFEYQNTPAITAVNPVAGALAGGTTLTITGTDFSNFGGDPTATVGGNPCSPLAYVSSTSLTCTLPPGSSGAQDVVVSLNSGLSDTAVGAYTYRPAPTFTSITPNYGISAGGTSVTIVGANFTNLGGNPSVTLGGLNCAGVTVVDPNTITCTTISSASAGAVDVVVTLSDSQSVTASGGYTYQDAPTISSISPVGGVTGGSTTVIINGTNFSNQGSNPTVSLNGVACQSVTFNSSTSLDCLSDVGVLGIGDVVVTNADTQTVTGTNLFEYRDDPTISSVSPAYGPITGGTTLTIDGTNFSNHTALPTVSVGGVSCGSVTYVSSIQITCVTSTGMPAGLGNVVVTNASTQSVTSASAFEALAAPTLTSISPVGGVLLGGGTLTVTGTNFSNLGAGPGVSVGGSACTPLTFVSSTSLTCTIPGGSAGTADVVITNPDAVAVTGTGVYEYLNDPTFVSVSPNFGAQGGGSALTITGTNFSNHTSDPTVTVDGVACTPVVFGSSTSITCTTGVGMSLGAVDIIITNASGQTVTAVGGFTTQAAPTLTTVSPNYGALAGGTVITLTGTNFSNLGANPTIEIGGVACASMSYDSTTQLTCTSDAGSVGAQDVKITNADSQSVTFASSFTYQDVPTVASVSPVGGVIAGSTLITITGTNFSTLGGNPTVLVGAVGCTGVSVSSATELTCTTGASALGTNTITVTNFDTQSATSGSAIYEYRDDPTVVSITPDLGAIAGGTSVTITGTNFSAHSADPGITIGGIACASIAYVNATTLTCTSAAGMSAGAQDVVVTNASTQAGTLSSGFEVLATPTASSLSPAFGAALGTPTISLIGTNFSNSGSGPSASVGGVACTTTTYISATQVDCVVDASLAAGTYDVVYTGPDSVTATLSSSYQALAAPTLVSVAPVGGNATTGGTTITLTGTNFSSLGSGPTITVGGVACGSVNVVSSTSATCVTGAGAAGVVDIVFTNPDSQAVTLSSSYHYLDDPTISGVSPNGGLLAGGTTIAITGTNFSNHTSLPVITIGGSLCGSIIFTSATQLDCVTPAGVASAADVIVTNPSGQTVTSAGAFTYAGAPSITSASPAVIDSAGGTTITLTGTGFLTGATVSVGGSNCNSVNVASTTSITCDAPAGSAGAATIVVTNTDTQTGTLASGITYESAPTLLGVSPSLGPLVGGQSITLTGTDFGTSVTVSFTNGGGCTSVTRVSDTSITCVTSAVGSSSVTSDVTVTNTTTTTSSTLSSAYIYIKPPSVASVSPTSGGDSGGTSITVTGTDFEFPADVKVGGVTCSVSGPGDVTSTAIICTTGAGTVGSSSVMVTNPDGQNNTLAGAYTYTSDAILAWQGGAYDFGSVASNVTNTFTLENTGTSNSQSLVITLGGANSSFFQVYTDNCGGTSLSSGGSTCSVVVLWRGGSGTVPTGGPYSATLTASGTGMTSATVSIQATKP